MSFSRRPGFVFLVSVLAIGMIATEMAVSLILLGLAAQQSGATIVQASQSYEYAQTCAERGLRSLRADLSYDGGEYIAFSDGSCSIAHTAGSGNTDRVLCVQGKSGQTTRRLEISIRQVYPRMKVNAWKEVGAFTLCP